MRLGTCMVRLLACFFKTLGRAVAKCIDCGFLAIRDHYNDEVREATEHCRATGRHQSSRGNGTPAKFFCYASSPAFPAYAKPGEFRPPPSDRLTAEQMAAGHPPPSKPTPASILAFGTEVDCCEYCQWRPGKSPKEHEEMSFLQEVEARSSRWRDEELRWQKQVEAIAETRHQENRRDLELQTAKTLRAMWWGIAAAIVAALVSGVLAIIPWLAG